MNTNAAVSEIELKEKNVPVVLGGGKDNLSHLADHANHSNNANETIDDTTNPPTTKQQHYKPIPIVVKYSNFVTHHPILMLSLSLATMLFLSCLGFITRTDRPDLGNAQKGMEARGTSLIGARYALDKHMSISVCDGTVSNLPRHPTKSYRDTLFEGAEVKNDEWLKSCAQTRPNKFLENIDDDEEDDDRRHRRQLNDNKIDTSSSSSQAPWGQTDGTCSLSSWWLIGDSTPAVQLVYTSEESNQKLITAKNIKAMCKFDEGVLSDYFSDFEDYGEIGCGRMRSLGNYIAMHNNLTSCGGITLPMVSEYIELMESCHLYFLDGRLPICEQSGLGREEDVCRKYKVLSVDPISSLMDCSSGTTSTPPPLSKHATCVAAGLKKFRWEQIPGWGLPAPDGNSCPFRPFLPAGTNFDTQTTCLPLLTSNQGTQHLLNECNVTDYEEICSSVFEAIVVGSSCYDELCEVYDGELKFPTRRLM